MLNSKTLRNIYGRSHENRVSPRDKDIKGSNIIALKSIIKGLVLVQLTFFLLFCYIFGTLYVSNSHVKNLSVVFVDYDQGLIGQSVQAAYNKLKGDDFPTLYARSPAEYPTPGSIRHGVCKTDFWAGFFVSAHASDRLATALGGGEAALTYDPADVMTYIWNEARWPTNAESLLESNLAKLSTAAQEAYYSVNGTGAIRALNVSSPQAVSALYNPWQVQSINIMRTNQGPRTVYNTIVVVLIIIKQFFFLMLINGLCSTFKLYLRLKPHHLIFRRLLGSSISTIMGSLLLTGAIWAFRDNWGVNANQFVLTWMTYWLYEEINFFFIDAATAWVPAPFMPSVLVTWVILNVSSTLQPIELSAGFFKWMYALPAHEMYETLVDIWSGGCNPQLYRSLPILFSWWIVFTPLAMLGVLKRCHFAAIDFDKEEAAFQKRFQEAKDFERKRDLERRTDIAAGKESTDQEDDVELANMLRRQETEFRSLYSTPSRTRYGPSIVAPGTERIGTEGV
ncbi:uncharacterized protein Z520_03605 [Fonsecaea multimorphosa CBS 102226]|uniref:DUF3533 domain-containing protein n=1 Tax=Fonsecaea multimorphosa CBS 102226 TaxID=1442371 RepID=A0A0D2KW31_9EURO|nr:uncharacterized protein Z520_03605 [Fonsecaea multimorphosa CBS 102226]KIY00939.1 hypothetical protein Z520_03605 [Fonsecaea multimorphosa CBS 102226]OAL27524.1 hypothetical protein AYO22_03428 [Fonsecaea multimorphosa]